MKTLNPISAYTEAGERAAIAMHHEDANGVNWEYEWLSRAVASEKSIKGIEAARASRAAFDGAYRAMWAEYTDGRK